MSDLKSLVTINQAQAAPTTIPDDALVLVEIDNQVYKTTYGALAGGSGTIPDGAVATAKLADGAVTAPKLASNAVTDVKVAAGAAIALAKLANVAAGTGGLAAGTVQATFQALATRIAALEAAP